MTFFSIELALFAVVLLWLGGITIILYRRLFSHRRVAGENKTEEILQLLDSLEKKIQQLQYRSDSMEQAISRLRESEKRHVQKIGFVRFNPFADTGGEQSFVLALMDAEDNGITLTALHGRTGTRWYTKIIKKGKGSVLELSKEEEKAIRRAASSTNLNE